MSRRYNPELYRRRGFMKLQGWAIRYLGPAWCWGLTLHNTAPLAATSEAGHDATQLR